MTETLITLGTGAAIFAAGACCMWLVARDHGKSVSALLTEAHKQLMSKTWVDYAGLSSMGEDQPTSDPLRTRRSDEIEAMIARGEGVDGENT